MTERKATLAPAMNSLGSALLKKLMDEVATLRQTWSQTSQAEQQQVIDRLREAVHSATDQAVRQIAAIGFTGYAGDLEQMAVKDGIKLSIVVNKHVMRLDELVDHVGKGVMIVLADSTTYLEGMEKIKAQSDQKDLPLEEPAGSGDIAADVAAAMASPVQEPPAEAQAEAAAALKSLETPASVERCASDGDQTIPADL